MICSRTMRESDYAHLEPEGQIIQDVHGAIQMWYTAQHKHRLWEYALAQHALKQVYGDRKGLVVTDHGCGAGFMAPILYWLGHNVWMYECWVFGNEEQFMMEQMRRVAATKPAYHLESYQMRNRPLCELINEDRGVDAAFCISTLEHIGEYQRAFIDMLKTVKPGGLAFLTTDFAEDEVDHYQYNYLRAGRMFNPRVYEELIGIGEEHGFVLLGHAAELGWSEDCRLVNDYGFGSLALVKEM